MLAAICRLAAEVQERWAGRDRLRKENGGSTGIVCRRPSVLHSLKAGEHFRRRIYLHLYHHEVIRFEQACASDEKPRAVRDLLEAGMSPKLLSEEQQKLRVKYTHVKERCGKTTVTFNGEACRQTKRRFDFFALIPDRCMDPFDCLQTPHSLSAPMVRHC